MIKLLLSIIALLGSAIVALERGDGSAESPAETQTECETPVEPYAQPEALPEQSRYIRRAEEHKKG